jgi:hypothetical protein
MFESKATAQILRHAQHDKRLIIPHHLVLAWSPACAL